MKKPNVSATINGKKVKTEFMANDGANPANMLSMAGMGLMGLQFLGNKVRGNPHFNKALPWGIAAIGAGVATKYFLPNGYKIFGWMGAVALGGKALLEATESPQRGEMVEE